MNLFHLPSRRKRLVLEGESGPITLKQVERLIEAGSRPRETGVTGASLEGYLENPSGFGQVTPFSRAEEILGKDCVASHASVSKNWVCTALDPGYVPYGERLLETAAQLNKLGRVFRLVYLLGLPFYDQLKQSRDRTSGPRFTKAAQRWITERGRSLFSAKLPTGYWLLDFSERFDRVSSKKILDELAKTHPRELWALAETVSEAVISSFCVHQKEECRLLTERSFHISPPVFLSTRWLVGGFRPNGLRVIPLEEAGKDAEKLSGSKIGVVTLVAR